MPAFAVLEPPGHADTIGHADRFIFLKETFSASAFLFGPLWMMSHKLWLELLSYLAVLVAIGAVLYALDAGLLSIILIFGLIQFLLGIEATSLVRWRLSRRGWQDGGVVIADDRDLAERRFFDDRIARSVKAAAAASAPLPPPPPLPGAVAVPSRPDVIGLFPEPRGGR